MPEKSTASELWEGLKSSIPYLTTLLLSSWGGAVAYIQRTRDKAIAFNCRDLAFDLVVSSFAGLITHLLCQYSKIDPTMSAVLIAVSGHMGTRAIASFEHFHDRMFK